MVEPCVGRERLKRGTSIILPELRLVPRKEKYHIMVGMVLIFGPQHAPDVELMTQKSPKIDLENLLADMAMDTEQHTDYHPSPTLPPPRLLHLFFKK